MGMSNSKKLGSDLPPEDSGLGGLARRLASRALRDPRVQEAADGLRRSAENLRSGVLDKADERLESLIQSKHGPAYAPSTADLPSDVSAALAQRRREREERSSKLKAREAILAVATTTEERRVLLRVLEGTPWAGGERDSPRYTALLDALAPNGDAEQEMAVHRAIWSLAEREVLSVSPHGVVQATPIPSHAAPSEPARVLTDGKKNVANTFDD